jgi:hypothetical protein
MGQQQIQAHHVDKESLSWDEVLGIVNREGGLLIVKGGQVVAGVCSPRDFDRIPQLSAATVATEAGSPPSTGQEVGSEAGTETTGGTPGSEEPTAPVPTATISTGEGEAAHEGVSEVGGVT